MSILTVPEHSQPFNEQLQRQNWWRGGLQASEGRGIYLAKLTSRDTPLYLVSAGPTKFPYCISLGLPGWVQGWLQPAFILDT